MKKNIYKKSVAFLLALTLSVCFSCNGFLTEKLPDQFDSNDYYRNIEESVKGLYGLYAGVKKVVFGPNYYSITDIMCDDMDFRGTDQSRRQLSALSFSETNKYFASVWSDLYAVVNNANLIIKKVPEAEAMTVTSKLDRDIIVAEAKFIRAWAYFTLIQLWGDVPLMTEPTTSKKDMTFPERAPINEVLKLVLEDLEYAQDKLVSETGAKIIIRGESSTRPVAYQLMISHGAVRMLKAKVHLYKKEYPQCIEAMKYIIDRYDDTGKKSYCLVADFPKLFDVRYKRDKDRLKEVVWEIEADSKIGYSNSNHREFTPSDPVHDCMSTGYQNYVPSTSIFEAFSKQVSDKRLTTYRISRRGGPAIIKHVDMETLDQNTGGPNEILLRIGDALLVYAEALNHTGETEEAIVWVNKIRKRAGLIRMVGNREVGAIPATTPSNVVSDTILFERRMELAHEGQRLFDLRRTGKLIQALETYNRDLQRFLAMPNNQMVFGIPAIVSGSGIESYSDSHVPFVEAFKRTDERILLHPIPTDERRSNPNLKQNPGYF